MPGSGSTTKSLIDQGVAVGVARLFVRGFLLRGWLALALTGGVFSVAAASMLGGVLLAPSFFLGKIRLIDLSKIVTSR